MNYHEIQQAVWNESKALIDNGEDCNNSPLYQKLQSIFTKYQDQNHWKNPFVVWVEDATEAEWLKAAIVWFHACEPIVLPSGRIRSVGYSA